MSKNIYQGRKILITGASSGIGFEFARILNDYECSLILISSNIENLSKAKEFLLKQGNAKIICFEVDLSDIDKVKDFYQTLKEKKIIPDILINNAGKQSYGYFYKLDWEQEQKEIMLNCLAPIYLINKIIPHMLENNFGKILNVGSVAGTMPNPFFATYGATKAFLNSFSQAISGEMHNKNIQCVCLLPGKTNAVGFWNIPKLREKIGDLSSFASANNVAKYGLFLLEQDKNYGVHGLRNKMTQFIKRFVPRFLLNYLIRRHTYSKSLED